VKERRKARVVTVSGLALLTGGTAVAAVAGGAHSVFATVLLGLLALGMGHSLLDEIRRQTERRSTGWAREDTINAILLGCWAEAALIATIVPSNPTPMRAVLAALTVGYCGSCGYFVTRRRRAIADAQASASPSPASPAADGPAPHASGSSASDDANAPLPWA
jgi:hypothetical protein